MPVALATPKRYFCKSAYVVTIFSHIIVMNCVFNRSGPLRKDRRNAG